MQTIVGTNKYCLEHEDPIDINTAERFLDLAVKAAQLRCTLGEISTVT